MAAPIPQLPPVTALGGVAAFASRWLVQCDPAGAEAQPICGDRLPQSLVGAAQVMEYGLFGARRVAREQRFCDRRVLDVHSIARLFGLHLEPAGSIEPGQDAAHRIPEESIAGDPREFEVEAGARLETVFGRLSGVRCTRQLRKSLEVAARSAGEGKSRRCRLQYLSVFVERSDLVEVEGRDHPVLAITLHETLGLETQKYRANRSSGCAELRLESSFTESLTGREIETQDGCAEPPVQAVVGHPSDYSRL